MRNLAPRFTMRKDGVLPKGDWFSIVNKADDAPAQVYIYDEIGFWGTEAADFVQQLMLIDGDIDLHLNSPGGEIFDGLAIYNALKQRSGEVTVYVDGLAASAASFIAQAGTRIVMSRFAQMMIHDGIAFAYGNEADMLETAKLLGRLSDNIADIYHVAAEKRSAEDNSLDYFRGLMREETWMNGAEAVAFGLADEVTETEDEDEAAKATDKWNLAKVYNFAGRENAESPTRVAARAMLTNKKENEMGDTPKKNTTDPEVTPAPVPETTPPVEPVQAPEQTEPVQAPEPTEPIQAPEQTEGQKPANKAAGRQGVMINGKLETDWAVINRHFDSMNAAAVEQQATFRENFVNSLATGNKIPATQIDSLVAIVNGDGDKVSAMSDDQFAAFKASYESLPASPLFASHSSKTEEERGRFSFGEQAEMTADERADRIAVLEGTVAMHERTMSSENVKNTKSYIELQSLLADNNS